MAERRTDMLHKANGLSTMADIGRGLAWLVYFRVGERRDDCCWCGRDEASLVEVQWMSRQWREKREKEILGGEEEKRGRSGERDGRAGIEREKKNKKSIS
jgi:hypothetical protein